LGRLSREAGTAPAIEENIGEHEADVGNVGHSARSIPHPGESIVVGSW